MNGHLVTVLETGEVVLEESDTITDSSQDMTDILQYLQVMDERVQIIEEMSKYVITYATIYIPLIFIVGMTWWLFRQFIYKK